ncbi:MAG TPA: OB-fold domain-containing protein [Ramlibacter sp.]|nr:OB-fold domain-containing protein [Ramlibacter sp.]
MSEAKVPATPAPVMGLYEKPMWDAIAQRRMALQKCSHCGALRYPPGPACPECLSLEHEWVEPAGGGEILSWVIFRRGYLPAYPPPYNVIAVRLDEGPILVSNLEGPEPQGSWIGRRVQLCYATMPDGVVLPRFRLQP